MSAKPADRDEVAVLMQQQGLSRVQATKLLYEMTKQRKKEEAAAAAARAGNKSPILEIIQVITRFSGVFVRVNRFFTK